MKNFPTTGIKTLSRQEMKNVFGGGGPIDNELVCDSGWVCCVGDVKTGETNSSDAAKHCVEPCIRCN